MAKAKEQGPVIRDLAVILNKDEPEAELLDVIEVDHERILAVGMDGERTIPFVDTTKYITPTGRLFVLNAPTTYIEETKHLASVEMAVIVREAVNYQRPGAAKQDSLFMKLLPWAAVALLLILWMVKK